MDIEDHRDLVGGDRAVAVAVVVDFGSLYMHIDMHLLREHPYYLYILLHRHKLDNEC